MSVMTGSRCLAEMLRGYGVSHVFLVPAVFFQALGELDRLGVCGVTTHSELAAAYMADGYARARHAPGVCFAQAVGAANLAAGLRDAHLAKSPVVALTGGPQAGTRYRHLYQEIEDLPMFDPVTKLNLRVEQVTRVPDLLRQAMRVATTGTPGPVHLEIPGRLGQELEVEADLDTSVELTHSRYPAYRPMAPDSEVAEALRALSEAERPVIVAGGGVIASGAATELVALAEKLSVPVATSLHAKAALSEDHPLNLGVTGSYGRWATNQALEEADLLFLVGTSAGGQVTDNWKLPRPGTVVIQLDIEPQELGRNVALRVGLCGDARATLARMAEGAQPSESRQVWLRRVRDMQQAWRRDVEPLMASAAAPIRPERLCREISDALPRDVLVVVDTGNSAIWSGMMLELRRPEQRYIRCAGTLGWAFPAAMGAKCALRQQPVLCITGDGGFYYHLAELETAARLNIATVTVVINNHSFVQTKGGWDAAFQDRQRARPLWVFSETNLARVAESMGCLGLRVEAPTELPAALDRALSADRPALIDVVCDMEATPPPPWLPD